MKQIGVGQSFMERTKHRSLGVSEQQQGLPMPPLVSPPASLGPAVRLPDPHEVVSPTVDLVDLIEQRTSRRSFASTPLRQDQLSLLLWCTQGVKAVSASHTLRTVPSAGARHPFETYLVLNAAAGLPAGLYYYHPVEHTVAACRTGDELGGSLARVCFGQRFVAEAAAVFVWTGVVRRTTWRYQDRGYRYLHLDAGHVCQNLYLTAEALGLGVCAVAAFDDDGLVRFLDIDTSEEIPVYVAAVGVPKPEE